MSGKAVAPAMANGEGQSSTGVPEGLFGQLVIRIGQNIAVQALQLLLWCLTRAHDLSCPNLRVACGQLFSGHTVALGELMPQWQFAEEGWGNLTED